MRSILLCTIVFATLVAVIRAQETAAIRTADGFQCPVGPNGSGEGYYIARGYLPNGHLGDDWNGIKGGDTDLGDPVYATAYGLVVFAKNYHVGWGNVVILRHAFYEGSTLKYADSLYGHLNDFNVHEGQQVRRGQLIGHIGNNNGMYDAHLHFEIRKNLNIGMYRGSFPRDFTNYYSPNKFLATHLACPRGDKIVQVPINTFPENAPPSYVANKVNTPVYSPGTAPADHLPPPGVASSRLAREASVRNTASEPTVVISAGNEKSTASSAASEKPPTPTVTTPTAIAATRKPSTPSPAKDSSSKTSTTASATTAVKPAASPASAKSRSASAEKTTVAPPTVAKRTEDPVNSPPATEPSKPIKPIALEDDASEPPPPAHTGGSPIRRGPAAFRVDRFPDLRGLGY